VFVQQPLTREHARDTRREVRPVLAGEDGRGRSGLELDGFDVASTCDAMNVASALLLGRGGLGRESLFFPFGETRLSFHGAEDSRTGEVFPSSPRFFRRRGEITTGEGSTSLEEWRRVDPRARPSWDVGVVTTLAPRSS